MMGPSEFVGAIPLVKLLILVGKYLPYVVVSFVAVNILLAVSDYSGGNTVMALINLLLAAGGIHFYMKLLASRRPSQGSRRGREKITKDKAIVISELARNRDH